MDKCFVEFYDKGKIMLSLSKRESLEDLKRRIETAVDVIDAANKSAKNHDIDIVNLDFILVKLEEYILRVDLNIARQPSGK
jgi:hypothetical protein